MPGEQRINVMKKLPQASRALNAMSDQVRDHALELGLDIGFIELVKVYTSQLNKCAACLNTHVPIAARKGVAENKLATLPAWRDNDLFSDREKAALEIAEWTTFVDRPLPRDTYDQFRASLSDDEIAALIWIVVVMNSFNRISVVSGVQP